MKIKNLLLTTVQISALAALMATSAQAAVFSYSAYMDGPSENTPNASPGTGTASVSYDNLAHTLTISAAFSGLLGTTTAAHIHAPTAAPLAGAAGVATMTPSFAGFPLGVTSGTFNNVFDLTQASSWNSAYVTANGGTVAGAEAAFAAALADGKSYFNIHSSVFGGGEIRGFLVPVPEPTTAALAGLGIGLLAWARQRRQS